MTKHKIKNLQVWELGRLVESLAVRIKPKQGECPVLRRLPETVRVMINGEYKIFPKGTAICVSNFYEDEPYICQNQNKR